MDLETAVFRIAARQAAKLEAQGIRVPLEPDALKELKKDHAEFFVSGSIKAASNQLSKPFPVRANDRSRQSGDLITERVD